MTIYKSHSQYWPCWPQVWAQAPCWTVSLDTPQASCLTWHSPWTWGARRRCPRGSWCPPPPGRCTCSRTPGPAPAPPRGSARPRPAAGRPAGRWPRTTAASLPLVAVNSPGFVGWIYQIQDHLEDQQGLLHTFVLTQNTFKVKVNFSPKGSI